MKVFKFQINNSIQMRAFFILFVVMAPAYKLYYFDGRGSVEGLRFLFKYGNIDFEDVRLSMTMWTKVKNQTPFGQLPMLEYNGKKINQTLSICRYLGKLVNLAGGNDWENLQIDSIAETINDLRLKTMSAQWEKDDAKQKMQTEIGRKETIPFYLKRFEEQVETNNGYLVLGRLTWVDFYFIGLCTGFDAFVGGNCFATYPNLQALREKIEALPAVKKWICERPRTMF